MEVEILPNEIINYSASGIEKINEVDLLVKKDFDIIKNMSESLEHTYKVKQIWRTECEMRYAVLDDTNFPTTSSKYWQIVREQDVFFTALVELSIDYQKAQGELELLEIEYDEIKNNTKKSQAQRKIKDADIKRQRFAITNMKLHAHDRVRELALWEKFKQEMVNKEDFDVNDVNKHQYETFKLKWEKQMQLAQQSGKPDLYRNAKQNLDTLRNQEELDFNISQNSKKIS